jgi:hypothetical protein
MMRHLRKCDLSVFRISDFKSLANFYLFGNFFIFEANTL